MLNLKIKRLISISLVFLLVLSGILLVFDFSSKHLTVKGAITVDLGGNGDYLTIQEGIDNAAPGETVYVWDGIYNENITIHKNIRLIGNGSTTTVINASDLNNNAINISIEGVEITGFNITSNVTWYAISTIAGSFNIHHNNITGLGGGINVTIKNKGGDLSGSASLKIGNMIIDSNNITAMGDGVSIDIENIGYNLSDNAMVQLGALNITWNNIKANRGINITRIMKFGYNMSDNSVFEWNGLYVDDNIINSSDDGISHDYINWPILDYLGDWGVWLNDSSSFTIKGDISFWGEEVSAGGAGVDIDSIRNLGYYMNGTSSFSMGDIMFNDNVINGTNYGIYIDRLSHLGNYMDTESTFNLGEVSMNRNWITTLNLVGIDLDRFDDWGKDMYGNASFNMGDVTINDNNITANNKGIVHWNNAKHGYNMYDNSSYFMGNIEFSGNRIISNDRGMYFDDLEDWGANMYGNAAFIMGDVMVNDNVINSSEFSIYFTELSHLGYKMHDASSFRMGNVSFDSNILSADSDDGLYVDDLWYWGYDMNGSCRFVMGDVTLNDNTIIAEQEGIIFRWLEYHGYEMKVNSYFKRGNVELLRNTIEAGSNGIETNYFRQWGYNLHGSSSVNMGNVLIKNNIINSNNTGIHIPDLKYLGNYMYDNATFVIDDISINLNQINSNASRGIYLDRFDDWGNFMSDNSSFHMGNVTVNDNNITAEYNGITHYNMARYGFQMNDNSSYTMGNIEFSRNRIITNDRGMYFDDLEDWGANMYGYSAFDMDDLSVNNNVINSSEFSIYFTELSHLGYKMHDASSFRMGNVSFDSNILSADSDDGLYVDDLWYWGYDMNGSCKYVMGNVTFNDNTIVAENRGIFQRWFRYHGNKMKVDSSYEMSNFEIQRNVINSGLNGIDIQYFKQFGYEMSGSSKYHMGDILINNNNVITNNSGISLSSSSWNNFGYWGWSLKDSSSYVMGDVSVSQNTIDAGGNGTYIGYWSNLSAWMYDSTSYSMGDVKFQGNSINAINNGIFLPEIVDIGINMYDNSTSNIDNISFSENDITAGLNGITLYYKQVAFDMFNNSYLNMKKIIITNNNLTAQTIGIDITFNNCGGTHNTSKAYLMGIQIIDNWIDANISNFNYTTINSPNHNDIGATQVWGTVILDSNDFDAGNYSVVFDWQQPNATIAQPVFYILDTIIHDGSANSTGLIFMNITDAIADNLTIDNFGQGIYTRNSSVKYMFNSTITNCLNVDLNLTSASYILIVNSTFNESNIYFEDNKSILDVGWFMNVFVLNKTAFPVPNANVIVADMDKNEIFNGTADANGQAFYIVCKEYRMNITGIIKNYNDYTANATAGGYFGIAIPDPTMNQTKQVIITIKDWYKPILLSDNSDLNGTTGEQFHFNTSITDNIAIDSVHVVWWFGTDASTNDTMNGTGPYLLNITVPIDSIDQLHYYFTASDLDGNWLRTIQVDVNITDNDAPINLVDTSDTNAIMGNEFDFEASADDNIGVTEIYVVWWFDTGTKTNTTMEDSGSYNWTIPIPATAVQTLHYYFTITDAAGNWLTGPIVDLDVVDIIPPQIKIESPADDALVTGTIQIQVNASDENKGISYVAVLVLPSNEIYNSTPTTTSFQINLDTTTITDGEYTIKAFAVDQEGLMNSSSINITVDNTPPTVNAGPDKNILVGDTVAFDGSGCSDNTGIDTYNWSFVYDSQNQKLSGVAPNFTFEISGDYTVTLTVTDVLGNFASDTMMVNVKKPEPAEPEVVTISPEDNTVNVNISSTVSITFNMQMNTTSVASVLQISPTIDYTISWNQDNTVLTITFDTNLSYNTTYSITIGDAKATTSGLLQNAPYIFGFTTENKPVIPPPENKKPRLTQGKMEPSEGTTETEFTFTVHYYDEDGDPPEAVNVVIDGKEYKMTLKSGEANDGIYEYKIKLSEGEHNYYFTANDGEDTAEPGDSSPTTSETARSTPEIKKPKEKADDTTTIFLIILIIIIIILIFLVLMMRRKKHVVEEPVEAEEEVVEETKEAAEEFECPDCGASLAAGVNECPECGAEFEEEEEEGLEDDDEEEDMDIDTGEDEAEEIDEDIEADEEIEEEFVDEEPEEIPVSDEEAEEELMEEEPIDNMDSDEEMEEELMDEE